MELEINVVGMDRRSKGNPNRQIPSRWNVMREIVFYIISTKGKLLLKKKKKFLRRAARWHSPHFRKLYSQKYAGVISFPDMKSFRFEFFFSIFHLWNVDDFYFQ